MSRSAISYSIDYVGNRSNLVIYRRSGNIREVLIFANFARRTNSRIQESRENYYYNSATKGKLKFTNFKLCEKSQNLKFAEIETRENYRIYSILYFKNLKKYIKILLFA